MYTCLSHCASLVSVIVCVYAIFISIISIGVSFNLMFVIHNYIIEQLT